MLSTKGETRVAALLAYLYSVNTAETLRIANDAEAIIRFMAQGPEGYPFQFVDRAEDINQKNKGKATYKGRTIQTKHGDPEGSLLP